MQKHVMVDIETLATAPEAIILSIGAVEFDPYSGEVFETFYTEISPDQPRRLDMKTLQWWLKQETPIPLNGIVPLSVALVDLRQFLELSKESDKELILWANGTDFDKVVLENAYRQLGILAPWKYNSWRDARTMYRLYGNPANRPTVSHNALQDCKDQIAGLSEIFRCQPYNAYL